MNKKIERKIMKKKKKKRAGGEMCLCMHAVHF